MSDIGEWLSTSRIESYYDSGMTLKSTKTEICTNGGMAKNNTLIQDLFSFFQEDRLFVSSINHNKEPRSCALWLVECAESRWDGESVRQRDGALENWCSREPEHTFPTIFFGLAAVNYGQKNVTYFSEQLNNPPFNLFSWPDFIDLDQWGSAAIVVALCWGWRQ